MVDGTKIIDVKWTGLFSFKDTFVHRRHKSEKHLSQKYNLRLVSLSFSLKGRGYNSDTQMLYKQKQNEVKI